MYGPQKRFWPNFGLDIDAGKLVLAHPRVAAQETEMANNLRTAASRFSLARLGMTSLPEAILMPKARSLVAHITVLDLKRNALQLLPSELFLCLTQLQEMDASEVGTPIRKYFVLVFFFLSCIVCRMKLPPHLTPFHTGWRRRVDSRRCQVLLEKGKSCSYEQASRRGWF